MTHPPRKPYPPLRTFDSPCKGICRIEESLGWCRGCRRTRAEIKAWATASDSRKRQILDLIALRGMSPATVR